MKSNIYIEVKDYDKDCVVMVKDGLFYRTYDDDALILFLMFGYTVNNNVASFPREKLKSVVGKLSKCGLSSVVISKYNIERNICDCSNYESYVAQAKEKYKIYEGIRIVSKKISYLLRDNYDFHDRIEKFLIDLKENTL